MKVSLAALGTAFVALCTAWVLFPLAPAVSAPVSQPTQSGVTIVAQNPGTSSLGSPLRITLAVHSEPTSVASPSCRPQDLTLRCWGTLVLRDPGHGGFSVSGLQVHRVDIGGTSCGGAEQQGGCGSTQMAATAPYPPQPLQAQVNGIAFVTDPGSTGVPINTEVQLLMTLTDNGPAQYGDHIQIVVNRFVAGQNKPLLFNTGQQTIQQVTIHQ